MAARDDVNHRIDTFLTGGDSLQHSVNFKALRFAAMIIFDDFHGREPLGHALLRHLA